MTRPVENPDQDNKNLATRRLDTTRHLLHPTHWRGSLALDQQPSLRNAALAGFQAALTMALALPLIYFSPWHAFIGFAALGALTSLFGRFARPGQRKYVLAFCCLFQTAVVFLTSLTVWLNIGAQLQLVVLSLACGIIFFITVSARLGAPGALIFVFAAGASFAPVDQFNDVLVRTGVTFAVAILGLIICLSSEKLREHGSDQRPLPQEVARPFSHRLIATVRITAGCALAIFISDSFGAAHPAWAAMGGLAVMQGMHLHINMMRALQRMAGTIIGAILTWIILTQEPSIWTIIALLCVLQFMTEVIIGSNYGLGQIFVTPMALFMSYLSSPGADASIAPERAMDTVLGACIGIICAIIFSTIDDRYYLARIRNEEK